MPVPGRPPSRLPWAGVIAALVLLTASCASEAPAASPTPTPPTAATARPGSPPRLGPETATPRPLVPFELPKAGGGTLKLADYLGKQPVNVVFYRGFF